MALSAKPRIVLEMKIVVAGTRVGAQCLSQKIENFLVVSLRSISICRSVPSTKDDEIGKIW